MKTFIEHVLSVELQNEQSLLTALKNLNITGLGGIRKAMAILQKLPGNISVMLKKFVAKRMNAPVMQQLKTKIDAIKQGDLRGLGRVLLGAPGLPKDKEPESNESLLILGLAPIAIALLYALSKWGDDIGKPWYLQKY